MKDKPVMPSKKPYVFVKMKVQSPENVKRIT